MDKTIKQLAPSKMAGILTESNYQMASDTVHGSPGVIKKPQAKMSELKSISKPLDIGPTPMVNGDCLSTKVLELEYCVYVCTHEQSDI